MTKRTFDQGFSIIELIVAVGILSLFIAGSTYLVLGSYEPFFGSGDTREMDRLAREGLELLKVVKERDWGLLTNSAWYGETASNVALSQDGSGQWIVSAGTEVRGSFTRAIKLFWVLRDGSGVIATEGIVDPSTVKAEISISATGRADYILEAYLTNWESYRMTQDDWRGSFNTETWIAGQDDYNTSTGMDLPTSTTGDIVPDLTLQVATST